jgi:uroporphyrinogen decarboxylase
MLEQPELVEEWLEARLQAELRRVTLIADPRHIPIALTYDDIAYKTGPLFSPDWLRRYWVPRLKRLVDAWHARDVKCLFHSDGNLWMVMDDLVGAGIDGLNPLEVMAGMSVKAVREKYPHLFLTGGIDVSQLLTYGTPDEVRTACQQAIHDSSGRGYFLGSTTELHWDVALANAVAMFETAWQGVAQPA